MISTFKQTWDIININWRFISEKNLYPLFSDRCIDWFIVGFFLLSLYIFGGNGGKGSLNKLKII